jgi:hypothetical protein
MIKKSNFNQFADDTCVYVSHKELLIAAEILQAEMVRIFGWSSANKLTLNIKMTKIMIFGTAIKIKNLPTPKITLDGKELVGVQIYKYLGVTLDGSLTFTDHIRAMRSTINNNLYLFRRIRDRLTLTAALSVYRGMILPFFDYADIAYEGCSKAQLAKLQRMQNSGLRTVHYQQGESLSTVELHSKYKITTLEIRRKQHLANFMYCRSRKPKYLANPTTVNTRAEAKIKLATIQPKIEKVKQSILYRGSKLWNALGVDHQNKNSYNKFKRATKRLVN